jgi:hypothetical protein
MPQEIDFIFKLNFCQNGHISTLPMIGFVAAGFQRHRTFGAIPSSSPIPPVPTRGQLRVQPMPVSQAQNFASSTRITSSRHGQPEELLPSGTRDVKPPNSRNPVTQIRQANKESSKKQQEAPHPGVASGRIEKATRPGKYGGKALTQKG